MLTKIKNQFIKHKARSIIITLIILSGGYYVYGKAFGSSTSGTKYTIGQVTRGTIVSTVTATGQVSASNEVTLTAKSSGLVTSIPVKTGDRITSGSLIVAIDSTDDRFALENAQISLAKLTKAADESEVKADQDAIEKSYADGWNTVASVFTNFPSISGSLNDLYYTKNGFLSDSAGYNDRNSIALNYINTATASYTKASSKYQTVLTEYGSLNPHSDKASLDTLINDTYDMTKLMSDAVKDAQSAITYIHTIESDKNAQAESSAASTVNSLASQVNGYLTDLIGSRNNISSSKKNLDDLLKGADSLDVQASELSVAQKQKAYADDFIRAPFDGVVAKINVKKTDLVSNGTQVATFITDTKVANLTLNEVDAAKVKVGDKATLTFDAIDGLSITGTVLSIDQVATVSSGVVNYGVQIGFDTESDQVKSGMSVSAQIQTEIASDVLMVPLSAVKTSNGVSYVQKLSSKVEDTSSTVTTSETPESVDVEVGISDDSNIEIKSGLSEGDQIITKVTTTATKTSSTPSILSATGSRSGGTTRGVIGR